MLIKLVAFTLSFSTRVTVMDSVNYLQCLDVYHIISLVSYFSFGFCLGECAHFRVPSEGVETVGVLV